MVRANNWAMKKIWLEAAAEVCGWTKVKGRRKETWWWNEDVARAAEEKNAKFAMWNHLGGWEIAGIYTSWPPKPQPKNPREKSYRR